MNYVDLAVHTPMVRTESSGDYDYAEELDVGVQVDLGVWQPGKTDLGFLTGASLSWREREDGLGLSTWEVPIEASWRLFLSEGAFVRPYYELGAGPHFFLLLADYAPALPDVALGGHLGFGATLGTGELRGLLGVRGSVALGADYVSGYVLAPAGDLYWSWTPSGARVDAYAGVSFR